jgi:hypothetical protein
MSPDPPTRMQSSDNIQSGSHVDVFYWCNDTILTVKNDYELTVQIYDIFTTKGDVKGRKYTYVYYLKPFGNYKKFLPFPFDGDLKPKKFLGKYTEIYYDRDDKDAKDVLRCIQCC